MALACAPTHGSVLVLIALVGCGGADEETQAPPAPSTEVCADGELTLPDGRCIRPGIPPDGCAAGFVHDGESGCEPILPEEPCAPGLIAVPGDTGERGRFVALFRFRGALISIAGTRFSHSAIALVLVRANDVAHCYAAAR